jgi:hypothetical protein
MAKAKDAPTEDPRTPTVTDQLPLVPFKVVATDIPFYRDKECKELVKDARIFVLKALDPEDQIQEYDLVPSTKVYNKGDYVTLSFDNKKLWDTSYYRDPESGEIQRAWRIHVNFIGELIAPKVIQENREHLEKLEQGVQQRIEEIAKARREEQTVN